jgi:cbb3-type cytochrome oxidase maturation protein
MTVLIILIFASLALAAVFLLGFIWAVRSGQFEDVCTPSMRVLTEESLKMPNVEFTKIESRNLKSENQ